MTKQEILAEQIINIANGLPTTVIRSVIESLEKMEVKKERQILNSISPNDIYNLANAYHSSNSREHIDIKIPMQCRVAAVFNHSEVDVCVERINGHNIGDYGTFVNEELLAHPIVQTLIAKKQIQADNYKAILDELEEKYKLEGHQILEYCLAKY